MLFEIEDLCVDFGAGTGSQRIIDGVSLNIEAGSTFGIVGESGCGKSILSLSVLRLLPAGAHIASGDIRLSGRSLTALSNRAIRELRGREISMIFQEPMSALNPVFTIGEQLEEVFLVHEGGDRRSARRKSIEALGALGVPAPEIRIGHYPRQLSGGMLQRVMIAMALACRPKLLIADEPTTALDVTIQRQILDLIRNQQEEFGTAVLFISHDLGVIAEVCDHVAVLYSGQIVEESSVDALFDDPRHPYTKGLMRAMPRLDVLGESEELFEIEGSVPSPSSRPRGCPFHPRCGVVRPVCVDRAPLLTSIDSDGHHRVACWGERS